MTRTLINSSMHTPDDRSHLLYCCTRAPPPLYLREHFTLETIDNSTNLQIARSTLRRRGFKCHDDELDDTYFLVAYYAIDRGRDKKKLPPG